MIRGILCALLFLGVYIVLRKTKGSWIWLLFACLAVPVIVLSKNGFFSGDIIPYGIVSLWVAGMIVPWFVFKKKGWSLIYSTIDLISWPCAFFFTLQFKDGSLPLRIMLLFFVLIMIFNVFLIWKMTRKKYA